MSKVTTLQSSFYQARAFNSNLSTWVVSKVTTLQNSFYSASVFNADLSTWEVSKVTDLMWTFGYAQAFNSDISSWNVSKVTSLTGTFITAKVFNSDLSTWSVSKVTTLQSTFSGAYAFNQDLSLWNVSSVSNFKWCFKNAKSFNFKSALEETWEQKNPSIYPGASMYTGSCSEDIACGKCGQKSTDENSAVTCSSNVQPPKDPLTNCSFCSNDGAECCNVALNCPAGQYEYQTPSASRQCRNMTNHMCAIGKRFESASATDSTLFMGATADDGTCIPCRPGKFKQTNSPTSCTVCAPGSYQNLPGGSACTLCPAGKKLITFGTYEEHDSLNDCEDCAILQYSSFEGQTEECYPCMTARTTGSSDCAGCSPGTYKNNTGDCAQCPSGYFTPEQNVRRCEDCPLGYFANQLPSPDGTIRYDRCQACHRGQHGTIPKAKNEQEGCNNCASGKYSDVEGLESSSDCKKCPKGKWRLLLLVF